MRRIFTLSAAGTGYTRIAKQLNAEGGAFPSLPARTAGRIERKVLAQVEHWREVGSP